LGKLFLSISYGKDDEWLVEVIRSEFGVHGIECVIAQEISKTPPLPVILNKIQASNGFLAVITSNESDWIQNEIGMAYAAYGDRKQIYGLVEEAVPKVGGILPLVCKYHRFSKSNTVELRKLLVEIAREFTPEAAVQTHGVVAVSPQPWPYRATQDSRYPVGEGTEILTSTDDHQNTVRVLVAGRPHEVLHGDEVVTVYIPPQFDLTSPLNNPSEEIHTDLPASAGDIMITVNPDEDPNYPGFWVVKATLRFPEAQSSLKGGWFSFRLSQVVAPKVAGTYRFYGRDEILVVGVTPTPSQFDFHPIYVKGEYVTWSLSGILFLSKDKPLTLPAVVWATGTAAVPSTHQSTGRKVTSVCYVTSREKGHYALDLAPGVYDLYGGALGYSQFLIASELSMFEPRELNGFVLHSLSRADVSLQARETIRKCHYCGAEFSPTDIICGKCGTPATDLETH
jgi:hypothetical protein